MATREGKVLSFDAERSVGTAVCTATGEQFEFDADGPLEPGEIVCLNIEDAGEGHTAEEQEEEAVDLRPLPDADLGESGGQLVTADDAGRAGAGGAGSYAGVPIRHGMGPATTGVRIVRGGGAAAPAVGGMVGSAIMAMGPTGGLGKGMVNVGIIRKFFPDKGYGFVECQKLKLMYGRDTWVHWQQLGGRFGVGSEVEFDTFIGKDGYPQALNLRLPGESAGGGAIPRANRAPVLISGGPAAAAAGHAVMVPWDPAVEEQEYHGWVKSFSPGDGYGFIDCPELKAQYGRDVWVHYKQLRAGVGEEVVFVVGLGKDGLPQAFNVRPPQQPWIGPPVVPVAYGKGGGGGGKGGGAPPAKRRREEPVYRAKAEKVDDEVDPLAAKLAKLQELQQSGVPGLDSAIAAVQKQMAEAQDPLRKKLAELRKMQQDGVPDLEPAIAALEAQQGPASVSI
eukprot:TRINITY_DN2146_c0_g1_i1.p2 TRINITY_DN2146_c0_g1~~TRINITY_DN2146_c0_g1_i1.p2  ORF type:complete len:451 (+),score=122.04 TRINITY_DN2146_c0_g1_i1:86-1438(+)